MPIPKCCGLELRFIGDIGWSKWFSCRKCGGLWAMNRRTKVFTRKKDC